MNLAGYLLLFIVVGVGFILVHLLAGKLIRPNTPGAEKGTIYECGEPTIGSAWIQFDLRFYVVALLFVIFDVEVAFFFPWAEVFGKANAVAAYGVQVPARDKLRDYGEKAVSLIPPGPANEKIIAEYQDPNALVNDEGTGRFQVNPNEVATNSEAARQLALIALGEIIVFFGVLLVGFAYLWRRGDLEWVRSLAERAGKANAPSLPLPMAPSKSSAPTITTAAATPHAH